MLFREKVVRQLFLVTSRKKSTSSAKANSVSTFKVNWWHSFWNSTISGQCALRIGGIFFGHSVAENLPILKVSLKSPRAWVGMSNLDKLSWPTGKRTFLRSRQCTLCWSLQYLEGERISLQSVSHQRILSTTNQKSSSKSVQLQMPCQFPISECRGSWGTWNPMSGH